MIASMSASTTHIQRSRRARANGDAQNGNKSDERFMPTGATTSPTNAVKKRPTA
jgi:hypothetical protein